MDCDYCGSRVFEKPVTRKYFITVHARGRGYKRGRKKLCVWTEIEKVIVCPSCRKRAANENQRRDTKETWKAYMKKNPEYLRHLSTPMRAAAWAESGI